MANTKLSKKDLHKKYGETGSPLPATRVLTKTSDHDFSGMSMVSILAIDDNAGTYTGANVYDPSGKCFLGRGYDPSNYRHPLPAEDDKKWKAWQKRGYTEGNVKDFDVLTPVNKATEAATA